MLYPNRLQAALVFGHRLSDPDAIIRTFTRIEAMRSGAAFTLREASPGRFYRLFEANEQLMATFEVIDRPAEPHAFKEALASPYVRLLTPDIRDRLARGQSHILLEVSHGVLDGADDDPRFAGMLEDIGQRREGASQAQFERRLAVLALMVRVVTEHVMPLAVHWTQSDLLVTGEVCDALAALEAPSPLHVHPMLFGPQAAPGETPCVGIRTLGARHWLGREVLVQPGVLPWGANFDMILAFLRLATMPGGDIIPDGDTFGPADRSLSYRVLHHDAGVVIDGHGPADIPLYELVPIQNVACGFAAPAHVPDAHPIHDRAFPAAVMPANHETKIAPALPGLPRLSRRGLRGRVFGRKGL